MAGAERAGARVEVRDLVFDYGRALDGFVLRVDRMVVEPGEAVALVGPSGSGKSTLLCLVAGILVARSGKVTLDGFDWARARERERRRRRIEGVGLVFQEFELLEHLTVEENVLLPYFVNPALVLDQAARGRAGQLLEQSGIARYRRRKPRGLSQGERQRVALCRALVTEPELLLADEPTGNLDPDTSRAVLGLLLDAVSARGTTLVMVTHDHSLLDAFPRVIDLRELAEARPR